METLRFTEQNLESQARLLDWFMTDGMHIPEKKTRFCGSVRVKILRCVSSILTLTPRLEVQFKRTNVCLEKVNSLTTGVITGQKSIACYVPGLSHQ